MEKLILSGLRSLSREIELLAASMRTEWFLFVLSFFHIILCRLRQTRKKRALGKYAAILTPRLLNNPATNASSLFHTSISLGNQGQKYWERKKVFLICTDQ